jgi:uncharacterized BrkB/YihY/UPF0761 family membrane protein
VAAICVLFTGVMLLGSWPGPGRPAASAALRASLGAAVAVGLLTLGAGWYFAATSSFHGLIFQPAGALVGVLVWCNLTCRVLLRAVAWASTAGTREVATDGS